MLQTKGKEWLKKEEEHSEDMRMLEEVLKEELGRKVEWWQHMWYSNNF